MSGITGAGQTGPDRSDEDPHFLLVACRSPQEVGRGDGVVLRARIAMLRRHGRVTVLCYGTGAAPWPAPPSWPDSGVRLVEVPFSRGAAAFGGLRAAVTGLPLQVGIWRQPAFVRAFRALVAETRFAAVGFVTLRAGAALMPEVQALPCRRWLEMIDLLSDNMARIGARAPWPRRALMRFEAGRLARLEAQAAARFAPVFLVSPDEAARHPGFSHLPLSLPPARFRDPEPDRPGPPLRVCVSGNFRYFPNREAAAFTFAAVAGLVRDSGLAVDLAVLGRGAPDLVAGFGAVPPGLRLLPEEPADMSAALARSDVAVCAVFTFTGAQNKLLEAAAAGLALVATPGPAAVVGLRAGAHFLPVTDQASLGAHLAAFAADPARFRAMRLAAQAVVRDHHAEDRVAAALDRHLGLGGA